MVKDATRGPQQPSRHVQTPMQAQSTGLGWADFLNWSGAPRRGCADCGSALDAAEQQRRPRRPPRAACPAVGRCRSGSPLGVRPGQTHRLCSKAGLEANSPDPANHQPSRRTVSRWQLVRGLAGRLAALVLVAGLAWLNPFPHQPSGADGQTTGTTTEDATSITLAPEGKASAGLVFYPGARVDCARLSGHPWPARERGSSRRHPESTPGHPPAGHQPGPRQRWTGIPRSLPGPSAAIRWAV